MNRPYSTYPNNYEADIPYSCDVVYATPSPTPTQNQNHNHNRYESPVRDHNHKAFRLKTEEKFKDHYDVSNFKFSDIATTKSRTNHTNFCELSFDGTKSTKHHRKKTIKRVTSATTINCLPKRGIIEPERVRLQECERDERNKDNTYHYLAEQFKNNVKFIEIPVKLHKQVRCNPEERNRFEVILSPKTPASISSLETMSNLLKPSEHRSKKIILTSSRVSRPHMHDREIQTAIIGIRNFHNMRLTSVNDIFYNMNCLSSHEDDTFNFRQKKNDKNNLTITHFPCLEIKCSSIFFEMPANAVRTPMPRRTLDKRSNVIIDDYNEACAAIEPDKGSEPSVAVASSEGTDPIKDKIFNLLNGTQIALGPDYNQKVNDLCDLIGSLISENANKQTKNQKLTAKRAADMYINIKKVKSNSGSSKRKHTTCISPSQKKYIGSSGSEKSRLAMSANERNRSRSISPPSRPSTPSCQINKVAACETNPREPDNFYEKTFVNLSTLGMAENKFSSMSIPSISSISNGSHRFKMVYKTSDDDMLRKEREEFPSPVPRNVFVIPPHVNKLLKGNSKKENVAKSANNAKTIDFRLVNILKKPPTKQSWVVPDFPTKFQSKCDVVNHFQCMPSTKTKKGEHDCIGPSVTFSSMVDIIGGENDNDSLEEQIYLASPPINTIVPVINLPKQTKTVPNKTEARAVDDDGESSQNNCNVATFSGRSFEKPRAYEKQASFYNSSFFSLKKDTSAPTSSCLQKRKEYDNKLKMQMQNKQPSKIPIPKSNTEQDTESNTVKSKLPVKISDAVVFKPPSFVKNQNQNQISETSKLFTTDIKNTPFIQLRTESLLKKTDIPQTNTPRTTKNSRIHMNIQHLQNSLNVTKDVAQETQKKKSSL